MALQAQSALLDELMGKHRNDTEKSFKESHWSDEDVCKYFVVGLCPHNLFINTKADLGPCDKIHDEKLSTKYQKSTRYCKMGYEQELHKLLVQLIEDVERRIRRGNERLKNNGPTLNGGFHEERIRKLEDVTMKLESLVEEAEKLGSEGEITKSKELLKEIDDLKIEQNYYQKEIDSYNQSAKALEVCNICGAFRIKDDAPSRTEEHLTGKMHIGYSEVRDFVEKLNDIINGKKPKSPRRDRSRDRSNKDRKNVFELFYGNVVR